MVNGSDRGGIASMTGYAAREGGDGAGLAWSWEMRSVNGRGLETRLRLPDGLGALEAPLRKRLSEVLARGSGHALAQGHARDRGGGGPRSRSACHRDAAGGAGPRGGRGTGPRGRAGQPRRHPRAARDV